MAAIPPEPTHSLTIGDRTVRRIAYLIPTFGLSAGLSAALLHRWDWAEGLVLGAGLAWLNFRWLRRGLAAFVRAAMPEFEEKKHRVRPATYLAAGFRYALIAVSVYVIFFYLHAPLVSIALGLCAFAAATITASVWVILQSAK